MWIRKCISCNDRHPWFYIICVKWQNRDICFSKSLCVKKYFQCLILGHLDLVHVNKSQGAHSWTFDTNKMIQFILIFHLNPLLLSSVHSFSYYIQHAPHYLINDWKFQPNLFGKEDSLAKMVKYEKIRFYWLFNSGVRRPNFLWYINVRNKIFPFGP